MGVSIYYTATRSTPFTPVEIGELRRLGAEAADASDFESDGFGFYADGKEGPQTELSGSTKAPSDPDEMLQWLADAGPTLTRMRRAVPDAEWSVALEDREVLWDDSLGYKVL